MRALWTRLLALVAAATLLVSQLVVFQSRYFCSMSGRASDSCCCGGSEQPGQVREVSLEQQDCCSRLTASASPAVALVRAVPGEPLVAALPVLIRLPRPEALAAHRLAAPRFTRGPPRGPPLFVSHCALLI